MIGGMTRFKRASPCVRAMAFFQLNYTPKKGNMKTKGIFKND